MTRKRVVIITGASRGLGREIALRFGQAGERVVVNFLSNERAARAVVEEIHVADGESMCYQADVKNSVEVDAMVRETIDRWGTIDVLVNNAAMTKDRILLRMTEAGLGRCGRNQSQRTIPLYSGCGSSND